MELSGRWSRLAWAGIAAGALAGLEGCGTKGEGGASKEEAAAPGAGAPAKTEHGCRGQNACKGQGGCAVSADQLKDMAAKAGIPLEKAGQPHSCQGKNECKGLGGCNM